MKWAGVPGTARTRQSTMPRSIAEQEHARETNGLVWCQWLTTPWTIFISTTSSKETRPTVPDRKSLDDGQHTYLIYPERWPVP